ERMGAVTLTGVLLCKVGVEQLAFDAHQVGHIGSWEPGGAPTAHARSLFLMPAAAGKQLASESESLVVDSLEVHAEPLPRLPVPLALASVTGGALLGFVQVAGALWPLYGLDALARHVRRHLEAELS
ncbi:MAG: hypothetical protein K1X89_31475, partial [Myxococcaceae bacterium]|nr:hypothetical protein [Myxococcaceae bacterium]